MDPEIPKSLGEAMATEPLWLKAWIQLLVAAHLGSILFVVRREQGRFRFRAESIAILACFVAAGVAMGRLYEAVGYVRLLGIAHLVCWGPVYGWILVARRRRHPLRTAFGAYLHFYLLIAGLSLAIDAVDVVRHVLGDGQLWGRHAQAAAPASVAPPPITRNSD